MLTWHGYSRLQHARTFHSIHAATFASRHHEKIPVESLKIFQFRVIVSNGAALFIDLIEILNDDWCLELNALATACLPDRCVCFRAIYDLPNSLLTRDG